jgi:hypothetical protein
MKIPTEILEKLEQAALGINYGTVTLSLIIKQGNHRYLISREESFVHKEGRSACGDFDDKEETG